MLDFIQIFSSGSGSVRPRSNVLNILTEQHRTFVQQSWVLFGDVQLLDGPRYWTFSWTRLNFTQTITHCARANWKTFSISKNKGNVESLNFCSVKSFIAVKLHWTRLNKGEQGSTGWSNALNILHSTNVQCCSVKCWVHLTGALLSLVQWSLIAIKLSLNKCWATRHFRYVECCLVRLTSHWTFVQFARAQWIIVDPCCYQVQPCSAKCSVRLTTQQLNITKQHSTLLNKCSVLFSEMFSKFNRGLTVIVYVFEKKLIKGRIIVQ